MNYVLNADIRGFFDNLDHPESDECFWFIDLHFFLILHAFSTAMLNVGEVLHERIPCPFDQEEFEMPKSDQSTMRPLQVAAYVVLGAWGFRA